MIRATVLALALAVNSCDPPKVAEKPSPSPQPKVDAWVRMRECGESATRLVSRPEWRSPTGDWSLGNWYNHYNDQVGRCYAVVYQVYHGRDRQVPFTTYELVDVFENRTIATCTDDNKAELRVGFCAIDNEQFAEGSDPCAACRPFVKNRMSK